MIITIITYRLLATSTSTVQETTDNLCCQGNTIFTSATFCCQGNTIFTSATFHYQGNTIFTSARFRVEVVTMKPYLIHACVYETLPEDLISRLWILDIIYDIFMIDCVSLTMGTSGETSDICEQRNYTVSMDGYRNNCWFLLKKNALISDHT